MEKIKNTMLSLRENPLTEIGGIKILSVSDYLKGKNTCLENRKETVINLPQADVLAYDLEDETTIFIRPSGTEPKIKGYIMVCDKEEEKATEKIIKYTDILKQILD